jgi:uncharacterized protein YndB with AHSA1/START domain
MDNIRLTTTLPATPEDVYDAWLSSHGHTAMTGGVPATSEPRVGTMHMAWAGYISGQHVELEPGRRILQTWRTTEFPDSAPDSLLEIILTLDPKGTRVTLIQNGIPDGEGEKYHLGWQEHYFAPMREHFGKAMPETPAARAGDEVAPKAKPTRAKATATARNAKPARAATKPVKSAKAAPARPAKKAKRAASKKAPKRAAAGPAKKAKRAASKKAAKGRQRADASKKAGRGTGTAKKAARGTRTAKKAAGRRNKK